jgi:predicted nucleotidyltransferase
MDIEKALTELTGKLKEAYGGHLVSAILYGSAAEGDVHDKFSDLNILCVLKQVTPRELAASEPVFHWWRKLGNPSPLVLSEDEVRNSTDCFPIEFHDMKRSHRVLLGADVVENLVIDNSFYRAQVEHDLRAKLLRLRQKGAGVMSDKQLLLRLMADSVATFLVLGRHALLLAGVASPVKKREVIAALAAHFQLTPEPFVTLLTLREGGKAPAGLDAGSLFEQYLKVVEKLTEAVDGLIK